MIKPYFSALLLVILWSCMDPLPPVPSAETNFVEETLDEMSEFIIMSPDEFPGRRDSLVNDLLPLFLDHPSERALENWYTLKSYWAEKYGSEENIQLYAEYAFSQFLKNGEISKAARVKLAQGRIYYLEGQLDPSVENTQKSFDLAYTAGDSTTMGWALNHLSTSASQSGHLNSAKEYIERGLAIAHAIGNRPIEAGLDVNKGFLWVKKERLDSAIYFFQAGIDISREEGLDEFEALATSNMSHALIKSGRPEEALALLGALLIDKDDEISVPVSMLALTTAEAYMELAMYDDAYKFIERGCSVSEKLELGTGITSCKELRSQYYEKKGDTKKALAHFKDYHAYIREQTNEAVQRSLTVRDAEQKIKDRDQKIQTLKISERKRAEDFQLRLLTIVSLGILAAIFAMGLFLLYRSREKLKLTNQQRIAAEAKLNVLQAQMKPHFIYNAMNGIQNYILKSDTIEAYNYLSKFASLLRIITKSSAQISIELEVEIELLKNYLELEQMRFRKAFSYTFNVAEGLLQENLNIPNMMIQPVVENAIIHGLSGMEGKGLIDISMQRDGEEGILCVVTDNGRGRDAALKIAREQGKVHLSIASINSAERIVSLHDLGFKSAKVEIKDLYVSGSPSGTSVYISLPFIRK